MNVELEWSALFDLNRSDVAEIFCRYMTVDTLLTELGSWIVSYGASGLKTEDFEKIGNNIWIAKSANCASDVVIEGPAIIGEGVTLRPGAYIRAGVIVGRGAVVGHSCEVKNSILFPEAEVPHFNYVGDSIMGYKSHIGAGVVLSNYRSDHAEISLHWKGQPILTSLKKLGALVGDRADIGCQSVLNPGTVIGKGARVYPLSMIRGYVPSKTIYKNDGSIVKLREQGGEDNASETQC